MASFLFVVNLFAVVSFMFGSSFGALIVSSSGNDGVQCCNNNKTTNSTCRSLNYALQECISSKTLATTITGVNQVDILIDKDAFITGKERILLSNQYNINISSMSGKSTLYCSSGNSMLLLSTTNGSNFTVSFKGVKFRDCGPLVPSAVLAYGPMNLAFHDCIFSNNLCSGLNVIDTNLTVRNSLFSHNYANQTNSFAIDFKFGNTSLGGSLGVMFQNGMDCSVEIHSSRFLFSEAYVNRQESVISHDTGKVRILANYYATGGGLSVIHAFNSSKNRVKIKSCHFEGNRGTYGGGLFLSFIHHTTGNQLELENCSITKNLVSQTGGGVLFSSWDWAHDNSASLKDCNITKNDAMVGGAMKIIFNSKDPFDADRSGLIRFSMHRVQISENTAMSGSALRLLLNLPLGRVAPVLPSLVNCTIHGHKPSRNSKEYPGAILSTRLGIEFSGENVLSSNIQGSAIYVSACTIHVKGKLVLKNNKGKQGGAIYVADTSKLILYPHSHLVITGNHADFRGGGLYVEAVALQETTYPYNPGCFLQYSQAKVPPSQWTSLAEFHNNSASLKGAAIYVKSLIDCLWDEHPPHSNVHKSLRWGNKIVYSGNFLHREGQVATVTGRQADIATDVFDFLTLFPGGLQAAPGEDLSLNISATDQLGNRVYSVPSVEHIIKQRNSTSQVAFGQQYFVLPPDVKHRLDVVIQVPSTKVYHQTANVSDQEYLRLSATQSSFLVEEDLTFSTLQCHPGFEYRNGTCVCNSNINGIERCSKGRYVYLKEGYWGGMVNGKFVTSICPRGYCECQKEQGKRGCLYDARNPDKLCIEGRENILCGRCKDGLSLGVRSTECRDCNGTGWFLAISMFVVLVFTLLIIFFNPNIPSDLRGILFYIQVLPFLFKPNDIVGDIVHLVSGISDLGRPTEYPFSTCAVPDLGNLGTTALNYVTPAEVLIVLIAIFVMRRKINLTRSRPFQCFLVLMILMYKYLVETSLALLHCVNVGDKKVFFYDGSWECYQGFHLGFLVVAVLVWFFLLFLPIPIICYVVHKGPDTYRWVRIHQPVIDSIAEGLKRFQPKGNCSKCGVKLARDHGQTRKAGGDELEPCSPCAQKAEKACQACATRTSRWWEHYVGKERGWWWAVDLVRRQALVAIYVFIQDWNIKQIVLTVACSLIFAVHCLAWPYSKKNRWANRIEAMYLLCLVILANLQSVNNASYRHGFSALILVITYVFALILFLTKAVRFLQKWNKKRRRAQQQQQNQRLSRQMTDIGKVNPETDTL
eukprot:gene19851-21793_t